MEFTRRIATDYKWSQGSQGKNSVGGCKQDVKPMRGIWFHETRFGGALFGLDCTSLDRKSDLKHGTEGRLLQSSGLVALVPSVEKTFTPLIRNSG